MPGEVVFSSPTADEAGVALGSPVRVQFSRGLDEATIEGNIRIAYAGASATLPPPAFGTAYDAGTRAVTITFTAPPERFSTVTLQTLPGLRTFDGAPVTPWTVTFSFGG
jgi:hypothetical protein